VSLAASYCSPELPEVSVSVAVFAGTPVLQLT
jgi:hypothetical protein